MDRPAQATRTGHGLETPRGDPTTLRQRHAVTSALGVLLFLTSVSVAQTTTLLSVNSQGVQANANSGLQTISADGRFVAFLSFADNLVANDTNSFQDLFVRNIPAGTTVRASVSSTGAEGNTPVAIFAPPSLSADGRFVVFDSDASNLVPGDTNDATDVFLHELWTGETRRVSVDSLGTQGNRASRRGSISLDGRYVAFDSTASNLVSGDTNGVGDIFVHDLATGRTSRVSLAPAGVQADALSQMASLSADGRFVAFQSVATNLVPSDTNGVIDIFVHDRSSGQTSRVSVNSNGTQANGHCLLSTTRCLSADGRQVVFSSFASSLVPGDTNGWLDVFVHDAWTAVTRRASISSTGTQGNFHSGFLGFEMAAGGRYMTFGSDAWNLVPGDTNSAGDVFRHDLLTGETIRVSLAWNGSQGIGGSAGAGSNSADGRYVAFSSNADNLVIGDSHPTLDVFLREVGPPSSPLPFCPGDGSQSPCPCSNETSFLWHGCDNSAATGGAQLNWSGNSNHSNDTLQLLSSGELPTALTIFLQSSDRVAPASFGDGLLCLGSPILRLYVKTAASGNAIAPQAGDPSITDRCEILGTPIPLGATRHYQAWYRDAEFGFCPFPSGNTWNASSGLTVIWSP